MLDCARNPQKSVSLRSAGHQEWSRMLGQLPMSFDYTPESSRDFRASMTRRPYGQTIYNYMAVEPCTCRRDHEGSLSADGDYISMALHVDGYQSFTQGDHHLEVGPGDLFFWRADIPSASRVGKAVIAKSIMLPRSLLERRIGDVDALAGKKLNGNAPLTQVIASHVNAVHDLIDDLPPASRTNLTLAVFEVALLGLPPEDDGSQIDRGKYELYKRVMRFIRDNVEEDLTVGLAAASCGISVRTLQKVLAAYGCTFGGALRMERLKCASRLLASDGARSVSITEIAHRFGFHDLAHFSRHFKSEYGVSPTAFRQSLA